MVVTIVNANNEPIAKRTANVIKENPNFYTIGQNIHSDFTNDRFLFDDMLNLIRVKSCYPVFITTVYGETVVNTKDIRNSFMHYNYAKDDKFYNNMFIFTNDKDYVYVFHTDRTSLHKYAEILTTPRFSDSRLMIKPKLKKCLNTFELYRKYPIKYFAMMFNKAINENLTDKEKQVVKNINLNTGNFLEYAIEQDKRYLFDMAYNKIKEYDCKPNNKYIDFRGYKNIINKTADGIEIKACFDNKLTDLLEYSGRDDDTNGLSTGHGYQVKVLIDYFKTV